jgi:regulation of enolase protein 1 (concanavalin A-like superfamily)
MVRLSVAAIALLTATLTLAPQLPHTNAQAASPETAPPLPAPTGTVVNVSTEGQLQNAVNTASAGTTIVVAPGTYTLSSTLYMDVNDLTLRGATNNRNDVILVGRGMTNGNYGSVRFGIWTNSQRITVANLTIRDVYEHHIILNAGAESPRIYNVRLVDAGDQFIKSNPDGSGGGVDNGRVEYSVFEHTTTAPDYYTNAVDVLTGNGWVVRNNIFRNIRAPQGQLAGPAVLFWRGTRNPVVEGNTFIDCQREIALGLEAATPNDNTGGIARNNFIYRRASVTGGDSAIYVADSPNTQVLHNTILVNGTYGSPIEYRFSDSTGIVIQNNLLDGSISTRNGASGTVSNNNTSATASMFVDAPGGDLHLRSSATTVIDRVTALSNAAADWDGDARPQGSSADFGADEFRGAPPPANQPPAVTLTGPATGATFVAPATIGFTATATDADGSVAAVDFYSGSTLLGSDSTNPYSWSWTNVAAGSYEIRAVARDNLGVPSSPSTASISVAAALPETSADLPSSWLSSDIGGPVLGGSATYASSTFTVRAAGTDIWDTADQFHFVYRPLNGDGEIVARVTAIGNTNSWAKAGVMIRESLAGGARHAFMTISATQGLAFQHRTATSSPTGHTGGPSAAAPYWVRLVRAGSTFTGYASNTGTNWTQVGSATISMAANVQVGLAVTSHNAQALTTATFSNVAVNGSVAPPPPSPPPNAPPTVTLTAPANGASYTAPAAITVNATATDPNGTIAQVDFFAGTAPIGSDTTSPYSVSWNGVAAGNYALSAVARDNLGATTTSASVNVTVTNPATGLPAPWSTTDIGSPALAGSATFNNGTFTVRGAGTDIWGSADQFHFVSRPLNGDGEIIARVTAIGSTDPWAKAGVMIRESLAAGARHAFMTISATQGASFQRRTATNGSSEHTTVPSVATPYWVRLVRAGSTFTGYASNTGNNWTLIGSATASMTANVLVGLAVTSHNASALNTATFTNTVVTAGTANASPSVSVTSPSSGARFQAPASIAVAASASDSDGTVASVTFYAGSTLIGTDTTSAYGVTWSNVAAGAYTLTAVAVDNGGASSVSGGVLITVDPAVALPRQLIFTASTNHSTSVDSYRMDFFPVGSTSAIRTQNLGKPNPVNGDIAVDIATLVQGLPAGNYFVTVTAIGPGGNAQSAPSPTFNR